jgi:hypothetical protein
MRLGTLLFANALAWALAAPAAGSELEHDFDWARERLSGELEPGPGGRVGLRLAVESPGGAVLPLAAVEAPGVETARWALTGRLRYEGVEGRGYLEMWSAFADGGRYFSRTLAEAGPLAALSGGADWRAFVLPFYAEGAAGPPVRIELNLVLPGRGRVWLEGVELRQYGDAEDPLEAASARGAGAAVLLGAGLGTLLGVIGALIGALAGSGRAPRFTLALARATVVAGAALVVAGLVAFALGRPASLAWSLALPGALALAIFAPGLGALGRRYEELELRRMRALDTR